MKTCENLARLCRAILRGCQSTLGSVGVTGQSVVPDSYAVAGPAAVSGFSARCGLM